MSVKARPITAHELWKMPETPGKRFELIEGKLVEVPVAGIVHAAIVGIIYRLLFSHCGAQKLGLVLGDGAGYVIRRNPDSVRAPDVSFISAKRLPREGLPVGFWDGAPDLAVEVVSPNDSAGDVLTKVRDYLAAGVRLVWVVSPPTRSVIVFRTGGGAHDYGPEDILDGGDVLPGFSVPVAEIFAVGEPVEVEQGQN